MAEYDETTYWQTRYDQGRGSGAGSEGDELLWKAQIIERLLGNARSVLDLGCGDGAVAEAVLSVVRGTKYLGVDLAKHPKWPGLPFVQGDITTLSLPPADIVLCLDVLFHLSSLERHAQALDRMFSQTRSTIFVVTFNETADVTAPHVFFWPFVWPGDFDMVESGVVPGCSDKSYFIMTRKR